MRKLKTMGVALVAVFAMSAVIASAAQAGPFTWEPGTTKLNATQAATEGLQVFTTNAGKVECNEVTGSATVSGTSATSVTTSSITYTNSKNAEDKCPTAFGSAKIEMNGCNYKFTAGTSIAGGSTSTETQIICPGTNKIKINAGFGFCTIEVGSQTIKGGEIIWENDTNKATGKADVTGTVSLKEIEYTDSTFCPGGAGTFKNGTYTGKITITAIDSSGKPVNVVLD